MGMEQGAVFLFASNLVIAAILVSTMPLASAEQGLETRLLQSLMANGVTVVTSSDPRYDVARQVFNKRFDTFPFAVVYARNIADVQQAVKCARAAHVSLVPRGGGHSYEGMKT